MRKLIVTIIALAVLAVTAPIAGSSSADARHYRGHKKVFVIKKHSNRGLHRGWSKRGKHRGATRVIVR